MWNILQRNKSLWNWFIQKQVSSKNIILGLPREKKAHSPRDIPKDGSCLFLNFAHEEMEM